MAEITAALVRDLREKTGAGMMDCKKALTEAAGDMDAAIDWLRAKGLSQAAKKSGRTTLKASWPLPRARTRPPWSKSTPRPISWVVTKLSRALLNPLPMPLSKLATISKFCPRRSCPRAARLQKS